MITPKGKNHMKEDTISDLERKQKERIILNAMSFIPLFKPMRNHIDEIKDASIDQLIGRIAKDSGLYQKYADADCLNLRPIGNRVWAFWYDGFESAPAIVKKCICIMKRQKGIDLVLIDKTNLEKHFHFEGNIRHLFESGKITIQTLSDIIRCQLIKNHGGFWFDATLFLTRADIVAKYKDMPYFSFKHLSNDLLMKKKWNEYFTKGRWSIYAFGGGIGNPLFSFIYDSYIAYFSTYNRSFNYYQTDYIWLFAYNHFPWAKKMIDLIEPSVTCSYWLGQHLGKPFKQEAWNKVLKSNEFQKLNWRIAPKPNAKETYLDYFLFRYEPD